MALSPSRTPATPRRPPWDAGIPFFLLPVLVIMLTPSDWPRWAFMWTLAFAIFCGCKWLSFRGVDVPPAPLWKRLAYLCTWPGMNATAFLDGAVCVERPRFGEWVFATGKTLVGMVALATAVQLAVRSDSLLVGWLGMVGVVLTLHFGTFHLISCFWRSCGLNARVLMNEPLRSVSIGEFWGQRWNTAFRDLTHRFLFRPLTARLGPKRAVLAGFAVSGIIHDFVISYPAGGGYGLPTLYFVLHGLAVLGERSPAARRAGLGKGWQGRVYTLAVLLAPAGLLFHPPFLRVIVLPFLRALHFWS